MAEMENWIDANRAGVVASSAARLVNEEASREVQQALFRQLDAERAMDEMIEYRMGVQTVEVQPRNLDAVARKPAPTREERFQDVNSYVKAQREERSRNATPPRTRNASFRVSIMGAQSPVVSQHGVVEGSAAAGFERGSKESPKNGSFFKRFSPKKFLRRRRGTEQVLV